MRNLLFVGLILFNCIAKAEDAPDFEIQCSNSASWIRVWSEDEKVLLRFEDRYGFKNFPIFSGVVVPAMVPLLQRGSKELSAFDGLAVFAWDRNKCKVDYQRPLLIQCDGAGEIVEPKGTSFTIRGLTTAMETQTRLDMTFSRLNFTMGLETPSSDYMFYFLGFPFASERCSGRTINKPKLK